MNRPVYFVGAPWKGHAQHSGYEVFCDLVGRKLWRFPTRALPGLVGKIVDRVIGILVGRRYYTLGNLLTEIYAGLHMLAHATAHYHVLYGDSDTVLLPLLLRVIHRSVSTTLHLPGYRLPLGFDHEQLRGFSTIVFLAGVHREQAGPLVPWARSVVVEHPVDTEFFHPAPGAEYGGARTMLSVGGHLRDFATLAAATRKALADDVIDELALVGVPARDRHHFDDLIASGGARFCDGVDDETLRDMYRSAAVVVLALDDAYANNALLEAMACGCLIVASDVGAVGEYLGDTGLRCPPHDPEALAATLDRALRDPVAAARLRRSTRRRSLEFSRQRSAQRLVEAIAPAA
jgi:glycosyltransferase involved in cell wall biosynthesis